MLPAHIRDHSLNSIEIWVSIQKYKLFLKEMRKNPIMKWIKLKEIIKKQIHKLIVEKEQIYRLITRLNTQILPWISIPSNLKYYSTKVEQSNWIESLLLMMKRTQNLIWPITHWKIKN